MFLFPSHYQCKCLENLHFPGSVPELGQSSGDFPARSVFSWACPYTGVEFGDNLYFPGPSLQQPSKFRWPTRGSDKLSPPCGLANSREIIIFLPLSFHLDRIHGNREYPWNLKKMQICLPPPLHLAILWTFELLQTSHPCTKANFGRIVIVSGPLLVLEQTLGAFPLSRPVLLPRNISRQSWLSYPLRFYSI